jgi:hypothetical protein
LKKLDKDTRGLSIKFIGTASLGGRTDKLMANEDVQIFSRVE